MNRSTPRSAGWLEALEDRRLFSAGGLGLIVDSAARLGPSVVVPKVKTPNIVGTYSGVTSDTNEQSPGTIIAVIKTQNAHGKIIGFVESTYPGQATHKTDFTGTITGDTFVMNTATTTVTGTVSDGGKVLTGHYSFASSDDSSTGQFVVTRHG